VDLLDAMNMLDVPEEVLGKLAEEGKLKSRRADGTTNVLREEIEEVRMGAEEETDEAGN